jgi:hypothetical protein
VFNLIPTLIGALALNAVLLVVIATLLVIGLVKR